MLNTVHLVLIGACILPACAVVEVREGDRVSRGVQLGPYRPSHEAPEAPAAVSRWIAGVWMEPGFATLGVVREIRWTAPLGASCTFHPVAMPARADSNLNQREGL